MDLRHKVALVTGSAHRVGRAAALALAREGAHIVIHYGQSDQAATQTAAEIAALGVETLTFSADLADPAQIAALFEAVQTRFGRLDVLVNSAASFQKQPFDAITPDDWDRVMAVNLRAPFLCSQHAAHLMRVSARQAPALIVNIGDLSGVYAWREFVQHGVSKAALRHLTHITARELAPDVRVNTLILGPVLPPPGMDPSSERWRHMTSNLPLGRSADPEEVGHAVVSLAHNDYITGAELFLDGGEHLLGPGSH